MTSLAKAWRQYSAKVDADQIPRNHQAYLKVSSGASLKPLRASSAGDSEFFEISILIELLGLSSDQTKDVIRVMDEKDKKLFEIGMEFIQCARKGRVTRLAEIARSGFNVNFVHPTHGRAAIHDIAAGGSRRLLRAFLSADDIDFLARDRDGRLPSEIAIDSNRDAVIRRFFEAKERQATAINSENPKSNDL